MRQLLLRALQASGPAGRARGNRVRVDSATAGIEELSNSKNKKYEDGQDRKRFLSPCHSLIRVAYKCTVSTAHHPLLVFEAL